MPSSTEAPSSSSSGMITTTMMIPNDHLAAAVAAAAEIAKNGGAFHHFFPPGLMTTSSSSTSTSTVSKNENRSGITSSPLTKNMIFPMSIPHSPSPTLPTSSSVAGVGGSEKAEDDNDDDSLTRSHENEDDEEEDAERRIARCRARNREHARRTRLRKKAQLEELQSKVKGLQAESQVLKQSLEECSIASILVGLGSGGPTKSKPSISGAASTISQDHENEDDDSSIQSLLKVASDTTNKDILKLVGAKRKRFATSGTTSTTMSEDDVQMPCQPLKIRINGKTTYIGGGRSHINWKTGVYSDDNGVQKQLTNAQLESLRRERNRMHAKMTRDRKKNFIANIEKTIQELESNNQRMKQVLSDVVQTHFLSNSSGSFDRFASTCFPSVVPAPVSPETSAMVAAEDDVPPLDVEEAYLHSPQQPQLKKHKVSHGFTLD